MVLGVPGSVPCPGCPRDVYSPCVGHEVSHFGGHDPLSLSHAGSKTSSSSWTQNLTQADSVAVI